MSCRPKSLGRSSDSDAPFAAEPVRTCDIAAIALVLAAMLVVYWPALNGQMVFDDDFYLTRPELRSASGLARIWFDPMATAQYYPLVHTAFWTEHMLWGDHYAGYHLVNLLWHSISVVLVFIILRRLEIAGALLAAALFALHPVIVESVAWMTEQKNTLSTVFYLCALLSYLKFDGLRRAAPYWAALSLLAAALLTKSATVTFPIAVLIILWWQRGTVSWKRDVRSLLPFFTIAVAMGVVTIVVERMRGAQGVGFEFSLAQRMLLAGRAIWFYLAKLAWPGNLTFIYPRWQLDPSQVSQWIFPLATLATTVGLWLVRGRSRGPLAAWLYFCCTLFPVLGFLNVYYFTYSFVADHFQYLASLGVFTFVAAVVSNGLNRLAQPMRAVGVAACSVVLATLAVCSSRYSAAFANAETLYETTIERNPDCWLAHNNLGIVLVGLNRLDEAQIHYRTAIDINPRFARAHNNLANALSRAGRREESLREFETALALDDRDPLIHINVASALMQIGRYQEAVDHCRTALQLDANNPGAHLELGVARLHMGELPEALSELRTAQSLQPRDSVISNALGAALLQTGALVEAAQQLEQAVKLQPNYAEAHNNLGQLFARTGRIPQAVEQFQLALAQNENFAAAHVGLGTVEEAQGNFSDAIKHLENAIKLGDTGVDLLNHLGDAYRMKGDLNKALEQYQAAVKLKPDSMPAAANLAQTLALLHRSQEAIAVSQKAIETARATGQQDELHQFEAWLKQYKTDLKQSDQNSAPIRAPN